MPEKGRLESPRIVKIVSVTKENKDVITITFKDKCKVLPGQFVMVWLPGVDEVPMSLSYTGEEKGITVKKIGEATKAMHLLKQGDRIGIRGPYGTHFEAKGKKLLVLAGGIGIAPLAPLIELAQDKQVTLALGAKTSKELLFQSRLKDCCEKLFLATDDGSEGYHGFVSDLAEEILEKEGFDTIMTCGPELMIKKVVDLANERKIPVQTSLERYMKCGVGICDSCAINGLHVCKDGPVFSGKILAELNDFGRFRRDTCGRKERI
ncbi:MAG: dihydroorotate dehydrogenase electron transfer subunit [Thermoplasmata archaeon]